MGGLGVVNLMARPRSVPRASPRQDNRSLRQAGIAGPLAESTGWPGTRDFRSVRGRAAGAADEVLAGRRSRSRSQVGVPGSPTTHVPLRRTQASARSPGVVSYLRGRFPRSSSPARRSFGPGPRPFLTLAPWVRARTLMVESQKWFLTLGRLRSSNSDPSRRMQTRQTSRTAERAGRKRHRNLQVVTAGVAGDHETRRHGASTKALPGVPTVVVGSRTSRARAPKAKPVSFSSPVPWPRSRVRQRPCDSSRTKPNGLEGRVVRGRSRSAVQRPPMRRAFSPRARSGCKCGVSARSRGQGAGGDCVIPGEDAFEARCPNGGLAEFENASVVSDRRAASTSCRTFRPDVDRSRVRAALG